MTPETERTTHYFWSIAQRRVTQEEMLTHGIFHDIQKTVQEDIAVFEAQQKSLELQPNAPMVTIKSDAGPIAARRIIDRLIAGEELGRRRQVR
jgi:vanillate O-demethylase monooxygenase subunit